MLSLCYGWKEKRSLWTDTYWKESSLFPKKKKGGWGWGWVSPTKLQSIHLICLLVLSSPEGGVRVIVQGSCKFGNLSSLSSKQLFLLKSTRMLPSSPHWKCRTHPEQKEFITNTGFSSWRSTVCRLRYCFLSFAKELFPS